jgi:hypothetical protein
MPTPSHTRTSASQNERAVARVAAVNAAKDVPQSMTAPVGLGGAAGGAVLEASADASSRADATLAVA